MVMENYNMIIAGVIGSAITLLLTALLDYLKERFHAKIELKKLVFQKKADAADKCRIMASRRNRLFKNDAICLQ